MKLKAPLILASGSPRRKDLLAQAGFEFEIILREVDESFPEGLLPKEVAALIAETKAKAYIDLSYSHIVITADTIVALDNRILGKPKDAPAAMSMLKSLSGTRHSVITAFSILYQEKIQTYTEETFVKFRNLAESQLAYYIQQYQPFDKAGAYGIQEWIGMIGVEAIEGDFYNVMGLPVGALYQKLQHFS